MRQRSQQANVRRRFYCLSIRTSTRLGEDASRKICYGEQNNSKKKALPFIGSIAAAMLRIMDLGNWLDIRCCLWVKLILKANFRKPIMLATSASWRKQLS